MKEWHESIFNNYLNLQEKFTSPYPHIEHTILGIMLFSAMEVIELLLIKYFCYGYLPSIGVVFKALLEDCPESFISQYIYSIKCFQFYMRAHSRLLHVQRWIVGLEFDESEDSESPSNNTYAQGLCSFDILLIRRLLFCVSN